MNHTNIQNSSNIASVGYDEATKSMEVTFHHGGTYVYADVAPELHKQFVEAESAGKFFHAHIKKLPFTKKDEAA